MFIPRSKEKDPEYRVCLDCGKWVSLLGSIDDNDVIRSYDHMPADKGICTCWMISPKSRWNVKANRK